MKKFFTFLCALSALLITFVNASANTVTIPNDPATTLKQTSYLPIALKAADDNYGGTFSVSQQLYFASELSAASSTTIIAITFYCYDAYSSESADYVTRKLRVWINNTSITGFSTETTTPYFEAPGNKVFSSKKNGVDNGVMVTDTAPYTITLDTPFEWDGTSNIIVTVFDSTGVRAAYTTKHDMIRTEGVARFLHQRTLVTDFANSDWNMSNLTTKQAVSSGDRGYVNKITFTFAAAPAVAPATPSDLHVESTVWNAAELAWSAVDGATSYDLQQSTDGTNWSTLEEGETETSYTWSELAEASTQYVRIRANNATGSSDWSDAVTVTTDAKHIHDGITFNKWNNPSTLPTTGNYYLGDDVVLSGNISLTGNLNLCLNGHEVYTETYCIKTSNYTLAIYDNVGGGRIYGYFVADYPNYGIINVEIGGTLVMGEGVVENLYGTDPSDSPNLSYAIYNFGTLKLSGTPTISGVDGDIYLGIGKVITIESGKPLTNTSPYSVYKSGAGAITSGWANMSGADPEDYFVSANSSLAVYDNGSEAALRSVINIRDNADNSSTIHEKAGQTLNVNLTRSWEADGYYSTLCLPFDLSSAQVSSIFGAGTELATLSSSSIDEETIYLVFESASSIEAGKPYLINPANSVANPQIAGVTIAEDLNDVSTTYVDFKGTFSPTALAASENILCLGGSNSLGWPSAAGNLNGMRAYFEIHSLPAGAPALRHARFIAPGQHIPAAIDDTQGEEGRIEKVIEDGQVIIIRDGKKYNVLGINK